MPKGAIITPLTRISKPAISESSNTQIKQQEGEHEGLSKEDNKAEDSVILNTISARSATSKTELGAESGGTIKESDKEEELELTIPLDPVFTGDAQQFIDFMKEGIPLAKENNIFPSVMMAQAMLESDRGLSDLTTTNHNLFGIKGTYKGQGSSWATLEDTGSGDFYTINDTFRAYPNYYTSIADYIELLNWEHYVNAGVTKAKTPQEQIQAIKDAGYATDSTYVSKIMAIITDYNLTEYDE